MEGDKKTKGKSPRPPGVQEAQQNITEAIQSQAQRQQDSEFHQAIIASATEGICACHDVPEFPYVRFTVWNDRMFEITGYTMEEINTSGWYQTVYPDPEVQARGKARMDRMRQGDNLNQEEWEITRRDGRRRQLLISTRIVPGGETGVNVLAVMNDITERKRAEEILRQSEERYRTLVEESFDGIFVQKGNKIIFANQRLYEILGYGKGQLEGLDHWLVYHPDYQKLTQERAQARMRGEEVPSQYEVKLQRKDGSSFDGEINAWKIMFGNDPGIQVWVRDITDRKRTEEMLRQSEEKYRTILENIEDGYYEVDLTGNFTFFNDSLCRMLGYSKNELIGMGNQQYTDQENRKKLFEAFNRVYRTGEPITGFDWEVIRKDGAKVVGEASVSLLKDSKGQPIGFRGIARDITERKRAEEALTIEKQRFETLSKNAPFGMVMIDQDGTFKYINPKFIELFGYDLNDVPNGKTWFRKAFPDPPYRQEVISIWVRDLEISRPGEKRSRTFTVTCKDGTEKIINFIPVQLRTGENLMALEDITDRKQAEEKIFLSNERLNYLLSSTNAVIYAAKPSGDYGATFISENVFQVTGYKSNEFIEESSFWFDHIHPEDQSWIEKEASKIFEKDLYGYEYRFQRKDGVYIWIRDEMRLVRDDKGEPLEIIGFWTDITEHKLAEEALRESEDRYRLAIESSNDGVAIVKGEVHIYVNQRFAEIFGYENPQEIIGKTYTVSVHPDDIEMVREISLKRQKGEAVPSRYEFKGIRKDGQEIYLEASSTKTTYKGEPVALVYLRDVTERKKAEKEMLSLQDQLRQSQKMEAIGQLAGGIAHDFNNLLTVIKGNSELSLIDLEERDPLRENIEEIKGAADKAEQLTRQLLAFSRKQILEMKVLDLNQVMQRLDKMLRRILGEDIELKTFLPDFIWKVKVDPGQIEQVIINLAVNARDAMPDGGKLTIETANVELDEEYAHAHVAVTPGRYVMLSMSDSGVGMTPEVRERIFEPFFTTKEKSKGTGLGLSTVYGIVKQSGGNIWVYSEPGQGTTFKIYLPQVDEPLEEMKEGVVREVLQGNETILIVEDEEVVRKLAVRVLKKQGYKVLEAPDGGKAFMLCEAFKEPIHLILTDVVMPGMSGSKLVERLKEIHPEMKALYMSGYTDNAILHHGVLEPGINFIQKPFNVDGLARKVREVLDK